MKTFSTTIVFDLDDTLMYEIDYLQSAFWEIAQRIEQKSELLYRQMIEWFQQKENVFLHIEKRYKNITVSKLKMLYQQHVPHFCYSSARKQLLSELKQQGYILGLLSDGNALTQRNKLRALEIEGLFDLIIISEEFGTEKPASRNFTIFHQFKTTHYVYVADNTAKDFIMPNALNWMTICLLNNGKNIHAQDFNLDKQYLPTLCIQSLSELKQLFYFEHTYDIN